MYLPRSLISHLYLHLLRTHHPLSPPVLVLVALEPDALCACRILTSLLKRDFIPHKIQPVSGYGDLSRIGEELVKPMRTSDGGNGGVVVCLGVGGLVDLSAVLGLDADEAGLGDVEVWLIDARRPWNLGNVFGGRPSSSTPPEKGDVLQILEGVDKGQIERGYRPGKGGIIVFDDGDIEEELSAEREAYCALEEMPDVDDDGEGLESSDENSENEDQTEDSRRSKKRKSWSDGEEDEDASDEENDRPRQRRRSNSSSSIASTPTRPQPRGLLLTSKLQTFDDSSRENSPNRQSTSQSIIPKEASPRTLRRRLLRLKRKHEAVLNNYYELGASYSEPISSIMYSLACELGREDNNLLWQTIVGVTSLELYGRTMSGVGITRASDNSTRGWGGIRGGRIRQLLRDEVRRLNPPELADITHDMNRGDAGGVIPTTARSPSDNAIRLSPEPLFLLIRHWSLYDSMLHSPYLSARLHIWSENGRKRLHKLLAKMGVSLTQCKQSYTHMDMDLKRGLRQRLLKFAPMYGLDDVVPPASSAGQGKEGWGFVRSWGWKACLSASDVAVVIGAVLEVGKTGISTSESNTWNQRSEKPELKDEEGIEEGEEWVGRFWEAYDALENIDALKMALPIAMHLHRTILRTGTSLIAKKQIKHLNAFRMAVVKDGPDVQLFTHPAALTKLALWIGEAIAEQEKEARGKIGRGGRGTPLVLAGLNESRGVYVVVGTGGGGGVVDLVGQKEKKAERESKRKAKEEKKAEKERLRQEKLANNDDDAEQEESEQESSGSEDDDDDDDDDDERAGKRGYGRNRFGNAFQEVVDETNARVRIDSFEHCVVEVKKEDLGGFLESLSMKAVVG